YDYKLAPYDLLGSMAHVEMLKESGYLTEKEAGLLQKGLDDIYAGLKKGDPLDWDKECEDVHTNIQQLLEKKVGDLVLKLQTARSRNDQVIFATKLYVKAEINKLQSKINQMELAIANLATKNKHLIVPGFTHLQHAQPVYLSDYLWSYINMLSRDKKRLNNCSAEIKITLGAGALAGTPIDWKHVAKASALIRKKMNEPPDDLEILATTNSLDIVSDRDFIIETISALSIIAMHLSRMAEDFIIWSTKEFSFIDLDDAYCTGSSLMPQKKNPDILELIRGYAGRVYGHLISVLTLMKGLPLTYNRDLQLDKEPLFDSFEIVSSELTVLLGFVESLEFNEDKIKEHLKDESLYATDLVYDLVQKGVSFKNAHTIIGQLIRYSQDNSIEIKEIPEEKLKTFSDKFVKNDLVALLDPEVSVQAKKSIKRTTVLNNT
ncbi:MAG: argininosuccinate lyase, partial [Candidatus Omnitrophota bacterium]